MSWAAGYRAAFLARYNRRLVRRLPSVRVVYCISEGLGMPVKIGISGQIKCRHEALRSSTWREVAFCWTAEGDVTHEGAIKRLLSDRLIRCEWFADPDDTVKRMLGRDASRVELEAAIDALAEVRGIPDFYPPTKPRKPPEPILWLSPVAVVVARDPNAIKVLGGIE